MEELIRLLNLPKGVAEIVRTSDGHFLGRAFGDVGANIFLGKPSFHDGPGRDRSRETWRAMNYAEKRNAVWAAKEYGVSLREMFGGDPYGS